MQEISPNNIAIESSLLNAMSSRRNYDMYNSFIDYKRVLPDTARLLKDYKNYYELYGDHEKIEWELFYTHFGQTWHVQDLQDSDIEYYRDFVLPSIKKTNQQEVETCLLGLIQKQTMDKLSSTEFNLDKLRRILDGYEETEASIIKSCDKEIISMANVDFGVLDKKDGIPWCLPTLQDGLGSLVKGQFIVVSADYGTGKSAFVVSQVAKTLEWSLQHNKGCVLYFNSEGTDADVFGRVCSNLYRKHLPKGFEEVVERADEVKEKFLSRYGDDRLLVSQISHNSVDWVYSKMLKYSPDLVIIDIADSLAKEEDVISLKKVFDRLRIMSGLMCPILATTQSGNTSYQDSETKEIKTRKWLTDKDLYGSKVGKGGAADTIITIGKDDKIQGLRYISTPKKKRGHPVNITCQLKDEYSLYEELSW